MLKRVVVALRIVHVSDIHFHGAAHGWDANLDQRAELVRDLGAQVRESGAVDAVLVGGDIAFSGQESEYETAAQWLTELVEVCGGIGMDRVWTVPGNHDVDRHALRACMPAQQFREQLRQLEHAEAVDEFLRKRLTADPGADAYFAPLQAYNDFARPFMCHSEPMRPHWVEKQTLVLDGHPVHITGLNSSMNCDGTEIDRDWRDDDGNRHLVLGALQCQISRSGDPIQIVIAHHPPNWIRDWHIVEGYMRRAHLWIFGHEHEYQSAQDIPGGTVQLSGGAVGPERDGGGEQDPWVPAYLLLTLDFDDVGRLRIHVNPRYWSMSETRFVLHPDGPHVFLVDRTPAVSTPAGAARRHAAPALADSEPPVIRAASASPIADAAPADNQVADSAAGSLSPRELARRFGELPPTKRIAIGLELNVLDEDDLDAGAHQDVSRLIMARVGARGLAKQLQAKVTA